LFSELRRNGFHGPEPERVEIDDVDPPAEALLFHFRQKLPSGGDVALTVNVKSFVRPAFVERLLRAECDQRGVCARVAAECDERPGRS
jgi:hypothetical protein